MSDNRLCSVFFFNDTATTEIYTLSLHDALPISIDFTTASPHERLTKPQIAMRRAVRADARAGEDGVAEGTAPLLDRKSTRLNSSHANISYAVFCLKKQIQKRAALVHVLHYVRAG